MLKKTINDFSENLVGFKTTKLENAQDVWINKRIIEKKFENRSSFLDHFAYAINDNMSFDNCSFNSNDTSILLAERYGGRGIGNNWGGGRCGNKEHYQLKGIGQNILAKSDDYRHSYGGLDLTNALCETVNTLILDEILPHRNVKVYGIIVLPKSGSHWPTESKFHGNKLKWGAILVREQALRPAHFFSVRNLNANCGQLSLPEGIRIKKIHRKLGSVFPVETHFIPYIVSFLVACADQFAFARAQRIMHGAVSPSNICTDGRWLDVNNSGFLPSGKNHSAPTAFLSDRDIPIQIMGEFLYTYGKFNNISLQEKPLIDYYNYQFSTYYLKHTCYVFGLENFYKKLESQSRFLKSLNNILNAFIESNKKPILGHPQSNDIEDSLSKYLIFLISNFNSSFKGSTYKHFDSYMPYLDHSHSSAVFQSAIDFCCNSYSERENREIRIFIVILKRCLYNKFYYRSRISASSDSFNLLNHTNISSFLDTESMIAEWIFNGEKEGKIFLFKSHCVEITYDVDAIIFNAKIYNKNFHSLFLNDILGLFNQHNIENLLSINGFSFARSLKLIADTLEYSSLRRSAAVVQTDC